MRDILDVIDQVKAKLPIESPLCDTLNQIKTSAMYTAPDCMTYRWQQLGHALNSTLPDPPETDWQKEIKIIMNGKG